MWALTIKDAHEFHRYPGYSILCQPLHPYTDTIVAKGVIRHAVSLSMQHDSIPSYFTSWLQISKATKGLWQLSSNFNPLDSRLVSKPVPLNNTMTDVDCIWTPSKLCTVGCMGYTRPQFSRACTSSGLVPSVGIRLY